ncbi:hypothetical protein [Pantoea septica]|uniref:hypothetical protein n=1 Tax=Pantoea septica TaxID=472695 RepID=UPI0028990DF3|nr:hypothetical protein [Pantoea septica]
MKENFKITAAQLAKIIKGKTLTVPEMHELVEERYPGYDRESLWVAVRTLCKSPNCHIEMSIRGKHRAYQLRSASERFFARSAAVCSRRERGDHRANHFTEDELAFIRRASEFDRLLRIARA